LAADGSRRAFHQHGEPYSAEIPQSLLLQNEQGLFTGLVNHHQDGGALERPEMALDWGIFHALVPQRASSSLSRETVGEDATAHTGGTLKIDPL
jgi:hypothetical protein